MSKSKNDIAWEKIFEKYCILDKLANNERISISSTEINQFREARSTHMKLLKMKRKTPMDQSP